MTLQAKIIGTGSYLPERVLTNQELETLVETSDEWIVTRTGMKERRIARADEYTSDMAYEAAQLALQDAEISPIDVDLILVATITPDHAFPSTSCLLQSRLGASKAAAMDLEAACTGYLYAVATAKAFIQAGIYKTVLVVASEKLSSIVDYKDRNTCILFGDGASSCVISSLNGKKQLLIQDVSVGADGEQANLLKLPAGGARLPASMDTVCARLHYLQMEGKEVFKHAVRRMEASSKECLDRLSLVESDIKWIVPHQANIRIIEAIAKRFQVPMERVYITIHKYGNTSASSIGIALDELLREKKVQKGDHLLLTAFGAGLTWGSSILTVGDGYDSL
ncbi:MAG: ketoacyl-ACP synthase III [Chlamydiae bacterium]|nr:ketoacyl-ACP synthase III [Chlamydiota bacterium]